MIHITLPRFLALTRYEKTDQSCEWGACVTNKEMMGKTPTEAVANLWLELHKSKEKQ